MEMQRIGPRIDTWLRRTGPVDLVENLFLRMLGVVYLLAFASLWPQIIGLIGSGGIVPVSQLLIAMHGELGPRAYYDVPSLFWFNAADSMLWLACAAGCLASLFLIVNMFSRLAAIACFILYLSLSSAGQPFTSFQWDALLLEAGFLAIFAGAPVLVWAYRLLLFRLTFESGWVKLASHDPNWRNLHALRFHFLTQPLPNPIAYYAYRAPAALLDSLTAATLLIEFIASIFLFGPRRARRVGAALLAALQVTIILTGNYAFFNLLTLALCLWALDDQALRRLAPILKWRFPRTSISSRVPMLRLSATGAVLILLCLGLLQFLNSLLPPPSRLSAPLAAIQPLEIVNSYGLFAIMTTSRLEIVLEGSNDQIEWREYEFPYKPGNTHRALPFVAPYQPRLDWQMWFAALGDYQNNSWVGNVMYTLLLGRSSVYRLLERTPFTEPPHYMRALIYQYNFTTPAERARSGAVWTRNLRGIWFGPVSLNGQ